MVKTGPCFGRSLEQGAKERWMQPTLIQLVNGHRQDSEQGVKERSTQPSLTQLMNERGPQIVHRTRRSRSRPLRVCSLPKPSHRSYVPSNPQGDLKLWESIPGTT